MPTVRRAPKGANLTRPRPRRTHRRPDAASYGDTHPARFSRWLMDSFYGLGWPWCRSEQPRIDAVSVHRIYPDGPTKAQADSLRPLMSPAEYQRITARDEVLR